VPPQSIHSITRYHGLGGTIAVEAATHSAFARVRRRGARCEAVDLSSRSPPRQGGSRVADGYLQRNVSHRSRHRAVRVQKSGSFDARAPPPGPHRGPHEVRAASRRHGAHQA